MPRPYWTGQITISLVSFAVDIYPASTSARQFHFHQIDRTTGQRIHYQNIAADSPDSEEGEDEGRAVAPSSMGRHPGPMRLAAKGNPPSGPGSEGDEDHHVVAKSDMVKGYEYKKGKYVILEPEELKRLRIPGKKSLEVVQFSSAEEIHPWLYDKPYFVVPKKGPQAQAFAIVRQAMIDAHVVGLGEIAFAGREHVAALAPPPDLKQLGMMLYTLRFAEELRDPATYFDKIEGVKPDARQLALAKQLIQTFTRPFKAEEFKDSYEAAVRELVEAKLKNRPLAEEEPAPRSTKVVDLMDALRRSLATRKTPESTKPKPAPKRALGRGGKRKLRLVPQKHSKTA